MPEDETFIKLYRSEDTLELFQNPNAFTLLAVIAYRARRTNKFNIDGLKIGEAKLGDFSKYGLSRQEYRTAIQKLKRWKYVTIKATSQGTIATILNTRVFDINADECNHQATNAQPASNHRATTNNNVKNDKNEKKDIIGNAFDNWWKEYRKKTDKKDAQKVFTSIISKKEATVEELTKGLQSYNNHLDASNTEKRYIKGPASWLRGQKWKDEYNYTSDGSWGTDEEREAIKRKVFSDE